MKKKFILIFTFLLCGGLLFILSESEVKATFTGVIEEINEQGAVVYVTEDEDNAVSGIIAVYLAKNPDETFQVGDKVKVGYDGTIRDTAPIGITTLTVELVE
ncbi:hypothetical protein JFL43_02525 [Viridibacillus sp. YIM B01967]|uniref:DUF3221 domain-containing protein n=1 Tax=Viridibacillus soli TaxID=2798301 RepID=A0ABS1H2Y4_9BACL|nr:hypothetical protein [Viridibacillus soli]MBK3493751.1 hypothetical protein [Viridibacillus soli]